MKDNFLKTYHFDCECISCDHTIRFVYVNDEDCPELYVETQLNRTKNFFQRVWAAIKYVFGYECKYGHWDCNIIQAKDINKLIGILNVYKKDKAKRKA